MVQQNVYMYRILRDVVINKMKTVDSIAELARIINITPGDKYFRQALVYMRNNNCLLTGKKVGRAQALEIDYKNLGKLIIKESQEFAKWYSFHSVMDWTV